MEADLRRFAGSVFDHDMQNVLAPGTLALVDRFGESTLDPGAGGLR